MIKRTITINLLIVIIIFFTIFFVNCNSSELNKHISMAKVFGGSGSDYFESMCIGNDGKIYLAGHSNSIDINGTSHFDDRDNSGKYNKDMFIIRLNSDYSLDKSFDEDGKLMIGGNNEDLISNIAIDSDNKIYLLGSTSSSDIKGYIGAIDKIGNQLKDIIIIRLNPDGSFDNTFDKDGIKIIGGQSVDTGVKLILDNSGKINISANSASKSIEKTTNNGLYDMLIIRLNPDGSFDNTFDEDGIKMIGGSNSDKIYDFFIDSEYKIYLAGSSKSNDIDGTNFIGVIQDSGESYSDMFILKLNPDGSFDNTFDEDGKLMIGGIRNDTAIKLKLNQNKIYIAGISNSVDIIGTEFHKGRDKIYGSDNEIFLVSLNPDGSFDNTFDEDGKIFIGGDGWDGPTDLFVDSDGKIFISGDTNSLDLLKPEYPNLKINYSYNQWTNILLLKFNPDGTYDKDFDDNGKLLIVGENTERVNSLLINENSIYLCGFSGSKDLTNKLGKSRGGADAIFFSIEK